jgi:hypothetical protein
MGRLLALALLIGVVTITCTYRDLPVIGAESKSPPPKGVAAAAVKPADLPGTVVCAQSGPADLYLKQGGPNVDGEIVKAVVERVKSQGLTDNWVQVLAPSQADCAALVNGGVGYAEPDAFNFLMRFRDDNAAHQVWAQGFGALRQGGLEVTVGAATGLGADAVSRPTAKGLAAFWREGANVSYLSVEGVTQDRGRAVAQAVDSRLR